MTIIAGLWRFAAQPAQPAQPAQSTLASATASMLHAQSVRPMASKHVAITGDLCFGQTPAPDGFDRFLAAHADDDFVGSALFAVDARIDNRGELLEKLGLPRADAIDDESLIVLAYRRWGDAMVDHLLGDFAIAVWNAGQQTISLFRDPTGQRPLHYYTGGDFVAFASMPQGLLAIDGVRSDLNSAQLTRFIADTPQSGPATYFQDIYRVEPAQVVRINRSGVSGHSYWQMPTDELRYRRDEDYIEAFRDQLDRATQARLRGGERIIAAHLSAGLDSGSVAATAARLLAPIGGKVLALTSAPRRDFDGPVPHGRIADESDIAATLVAQYPNMKHIILRSTGASPLDFLSSDSKLSGQPIGLPCNNVWWGAANAEARKHNIDIVLTGEMGNLTISAGGLGVLADLIQTGRLLTWLREVIALEKGAPRWRGLLATSFAPWLPHRFWRLLTRFSAAGPALPPSTLLTEAANALLVGDESRSREPRTYQREREMRWQLLRMSDPGNSRKAALLKWGIDERDPTADRRLVEFCFSLPPSQLLGGGKTRRLARAALADRLPDTILTGPRGYQFADWYETLDRRSLADFAARLARSPKIAGVIDLDAVDRLISNWPPEDWASGSTIGNYRIGLLRALSAGAFALNATEGLGKDRR